MLISQSVATFPLEAKLTKTSVFDKLSRVNKFVEDSTHTAMHVVMIRQEDIDEDFDKNTQDVKIDGIRVLFKKENTDSAVKKAMILKDKGYKIFFAAHNSN